MSLRALRAHFPSFPTALPAESILDMTLRNSVPDTFTLSGDDKSRLTQLLELAQRQARQPRRVCKTH
jgi:hypothetical protein